MSDCKIKPAPGQVWRHPSSDSDDAVLTLRRDDGWWASYRPAIKNHDGLVRPSERTFLRWATPAERVAAGLPPAPAQSEQNLRQADASMAEERIATLTAERDAAQRECAVYRREFNVGDLRFKLKQAEKDRDEAIDSLHAMRARAEAAEAEVARLDGEWRRLAAKMNASQPTISPEDRAWMDAMQDYHAGGGFCDDYHLVTKAEAAIAARKAGRA